MLVLLLLLSVGNVLGAGKYAVQLGKDITLTCTATKPLRNLTYVEVAKLTDGSRLTIISFAADSHLTYSPSVILDIYSPAPSMRFTISTVTVSHHGCYECHFTTALETVFVEAGCLEVLRMPTVALEQTHKHPICTAQWGIPAAVITWQPPSNSVFTQTIPHVDGSISVHSTYLNVKEVKAPWLMCVVEHPTLLKPMVQKIKTPRFSPPSIIFTKTAEGYYACYVYSSDSSIKVSWKPANEPFVTTIEEVQESAWKINSTYKGDFRNDIACVVDHFSFPEPKIFSVDQDVNQKTKECVTWTSQIMVLLFLVFNIGFFAPVSVKYYIQNKIFFTLIFLFRLTSKIK